MIRPVDTVDGADHLFPMKKIFWAAIALVALLGGRASLTKIFGHKTLILPDSRETDARVKVKTLEAILRSKNDNDPRLDRDFTDLNPETKRLLRDKYQTFAPEARNERGTIVYLLGRNIRSPEDWGFLRDVAAEPPCLSLEDCSKKGSGPAEMGDEVTLAYPSLVALTAAQKALEQDPGSIQARRVLEAGLNSKMPAVARLAMKIELLAVPKAGASAKSEPRH